MKPTRFTVTLFLILIAAAPLSRAQERSVVATAGAPAAIGPYSQAVVAGKLVFASGQLGIDPKTGAFVSGGVREQTARALSNLRAVLEAAGCAMKDVASCTVYLRDLDDFAAMNEIYAGFFPADPPSRATVQVARLPKDGLVEISCIAVRP